MKKLFTLTVIVVMTISVFAQSPQKMSYQAVIRNSSGTLVTNHAVGMKISILQGSATGTVVYSETYSPNPQTNANGLVTIEIGNGTPVTGTFSGIDWSAGPYYLKTEADPAGGSSYTITGTSQLLSVPYSLYSKTSGDLADNSVTSEKIVDGTIVSADLANNSVTTEKLGNASVTYAKLDDMWAAAGDVLKFDGSKWWPAFDEGLTIPYAQHASDAFALFTIINESTGVAIHGISDGGYGIQGESSSPSGIGVRGLNTADNGTTYGVYGRSDSPDGSGIIGRGAAATGYAIGVTGESSSTDGRGVFGMASAATGNTYGVRGRSESTSGIGVYGLAASNSGITYGIFGESASNQGRGVWGFTSAASGITYAVAGRAASTEGRGVFGDAIATSGTNFGVYGRTASQQGYAGYFEGRVYVSSMMGIGTNSPTQKLDIDGQIRIRGGGPGAGKVLTSDATGVASWITPGADVWKLAGNAGTNPGTHFIGTTDNQALEIRVNNTRVLRFEPKSESPNLIGGYSGNAVTIGVIGATIGGGGFEYRINEVTDNYGTVGGGGNNKAGDGKGTATDAVNATVIGGYGNNAIASWATIGGGYMNYASDTYATVSGGKENAANGKFATVGGGNAVIANGDGATVNGGYANIANGAFSTVAGGQLNSADGSYSFAVGAQAKANHGGSFVWSSGAQTDSWGAYTFTARCHGGARFYSSAGIATGVQLSPGGSSFGSISDRNAKANFAGIDHAYLLEVIDEMPVLTWNLVSQPVQKRHIGPMAQDFNNSFAYLFGEIESPIHINNMDAIGISLAGVQGLYQLSQQQASRISSLEAERHALQSQLEELTVRLQVLEETFEKGSVK